MSILIKGIKIPLTCAKCVLRQAIECEKWKLVRCIELDKHKDCPLISIPLHGRLIDADELIREHRADNFDFAIYATYLVQNAPTVLEEEEE